jgi:2'-5' RNA ligase
MPRLFIAINFKASVIEDIQNICFGVKNARWVPRDQMHLTLRFLGHCDGAQYNDIGDVLKQIRMSDFSLAPEGVGYFPPRGNPRILWVGIKHSPELTALRRSIDRNLSTIGIAEERKKFHPHITVARLKNAMHPSVIIPFLTQNSLFRTESSPVKEFYLYSSILRQQGALHRIEESYPFL